VWTDETARASFGNAHAEKTLFIFIFCAAHVTRQSLLNEVAIVLALKLLLFAPVFSAAKV